MPIFGTLFSEELEEDAPRARPRAAVWHEVEPGAWTLNGAGDRGVVFAARGGALFGFLRGYAATVHRSPDTQHFLGLVQRNAPSAAAIAQLGSALFGRYAGDFRSRDIGRQAEQIVAQLGVGMGRAAHARMLRPDAPDHIRIGGRVLYRGGAPAPEGPGEPSWREMHAGPHAATAVSAPAELFWLHRLAHTASYAVQIVAGLWGARFAEAVRAALPENTDVDAESVAFALTTAAKNVAAADEALFCAAATLERELASTRDLPHQVRQHAQGLADALAAVHEIRARLVLAVPETDGEPAPRGE